MVPDVKMRATLWLGVALTALGAAGAVQAADTVIPAGTTATTTQTLPADGDTLTVNGGGAISVPSGSNGVEMNAANQSTTVEAGGAITTVDGIDVVSVGAGNTISNFGALNGGVGGGISASGASSTILNAGSLSMGMTLGTGLFTSGAGSTITNSGSISGPVQHSIEASGVGSTITNSGTIRGAIFGIVADDSAAITNSGSLSAVGIGIETRSGVTTISNSGTILLPDSPNSIAGLLVGGSQTTIANSGTISVNGGSFANGIVTQAGQAAISNSGTVTVTGGLGNIGVYYDNAFGTVTISNAGTINSTGSLGMGIFAISTDSTIVNTGRVNVTDGSVGVGAFAIGTATITNAGAILFTRAAGYPGASFYAINMDAANATLNLQRGSVIQGGITFANPAGATLNIQAGQNVVLTIDGMPATINTNGAPYTIAGNVLTVVDPTSINPVGAPFALDLTRSIAATLDARVAPGASAAAAPGAVPSGRRGLNFWASTSAYFSSANGANYGGGNLMIGADRALSSANTVGFFGGFSAGSVSAKPATGVFGGVYWGHDNGALLASASLILGTLSYTTSRTFADNTAPGGLGTASARHSSFYVSPSVTVGLQKRVMGHDVTPSIGLRYVGVSQKGFTETGTAAGVTVGSHMTSAVDLRGQLKVNVLSRVAGDRAMKLDVFAGMDGIFNLGGGRTEAQILGVPLTIASASNKTVARGFVGADISLVRSNRLDLRGNVEVGFAAASKVSVNAGLSVHYAF